MESFPVVCQRKTKNKTEVTHLGDVVYHRVKPAGTKRRSQVTGQVTGHRSQGTGHRSQVTGHRAQVTGHRLQGTGHRAQGTENAVKTVKTLH